MPQTGKSQVSPDWSQCHHWCWEGLPSSSALHPTPQKDAQTEKRHPGPAGFQDMHSCWSKSPLEAPKSSTKTNVSPQWTDIVRELGSYQHGAQVQNHLGNPNLPTGQPRLCAPKGQSDAASSGAHLGGHYPSTTAGTLAESSPCRVQ